MENNKSTKEIPAYAGTLRSHIVEVPECIRDATGIKIFGRRIKAIAFTTDVAIIRNINADAILAVYPFTPQPAIMRAIMLAADMPVFAGVGGGMTRGSRVIDLARDAEFEGAFGVVLNAPTSNDSLRGLKKQIDIPIIITVVSAHSDIDARIEAGADILNVSGAENTAVIVREIRARYPRIPIIATVGPNDDTIREVIAAGANAITYTPPSNGDLFAESMRRYRLATEDIK